MDVVDVMTKRQRPTLTLKNSLENAVAISFSADLGTPVGLFEKLSEKKEHAFLFESTEGDSRLARYSFLSCDPCLTVTFKDGQVTKHDHGGHSDRDCERSLLYLQDILEQFHDLAQMAINNALANNEGATASWPNFCRSCLL